MIAFISDVWLNYILHQSFLCNILYFSTLWVNVVSWLLMEPSPLPEWKQVQQSITLCIIGLEMSNYNISKKNERVQFKETTFAFCKEMMNLQRLDRVEQEAFCSSVLSIDSIIRCICTQKPTIYSFKDFVERIWFLIQNVSVSITRCEWMLFLSS